MAAKKNKKRKQRPHPATPPAAPTQGPEASSRGPRSKPWILAAVAIAALAVVVVVGLSWMRGRGPATLEGGSPSASRSGTAAMVERLKTLSTVLPTGRDGFSNAAQARELAERVARETDPKQELRLRGQLGNQQLLAGDTQNAIDTLQSVLDSFEAIGLPRDTYAVQQFREFLAIAYLRLGEQSNCLALHGPESCLLPLRGGGIHQDQDGARRAIAAYKELLEDYPGDVAYRWLLNIATMAVGEYPDGVPEVWRIPPEVFSSTGESPRFVNIAGALGVAGMALSGGAIMEDFDGDGFLDLAGSSFGVADQLRTYRSNGDGTFTETTEEAGLLGIVGGLNMIHADYDNDGDADILVLRGAWQRQAGRHPNSLLENDGKGHFIDVTEAAGLLSFHPTQTAVWADFNNDGWLDLFIGNESTSGTRHPCELYENDGHGGFVNVAAEVGLDHEGFVKGVTCGDYDDDGLIDLYLSRFDGPNILYHNDGGKAGDSLANWSFSDRTEEAGVQGPRMSFPTWFFDYDNDGDLDLLAAPLSGFFASSLRSIVSYFLGGPASEHVITLYRNEGDGRFVDSSTETGLEGPILAMGANYGDIDNDGYPDCYFGTGEPDLATLVPNRMYRNIEGKRFENVTTAGGFGHLQKGHGVAFGDLDNDGDQDIHVVLGGAFSGDVAPNALFENPGNGNHWLTLILEGTRSNRGAVGARVAVRVSGPSGNRVVHAMVGTGGSFGSSSLQTEIGLGDAETILEVAVRWPGDTEPQVWTGLPLDAFVHLKQDEPTFDRVQRRKITLARP